MSPSESTPQPEVNHIECFDELSWNAEEISFIRVLGERLEVATMYPEPPAKLLSSLCEQLRLALRAEALVYVQQKALTSDFEDDEADDAILWAGKRLLDDQQCRHLASSRFRRIIDNELQQDDALWESDARTAVVICVGNVFVTSGYLIALNSSHPDGFGTREAGLLRTVAALLTVYIKGYQDAPLPFEVPEFGE